MHIRKRWLHCGGCLNYCVAFSVFSSILFKLMLKTQLNGSFELGSCYTHLHSESHHALSTTHMFTKKKQHHSLAHLWAYVGLKEACSSWSLLCGGYIFTSAGQPLLGVVAGAVRR